MRQFQVPENECKRPAMLKAACDTLSEACALPGVGAPLSKDQQHSAAVRVPTAAERVQALCLHALALHRHADGSCIDAQEVCLRTPSLSCSRCQCTLCAKRLCPGLAKAVTPRDYLWDSVPVIAGTPRLHSGALWPH